MTGAKPTRRGFRRSAANTAHRTVLAPRLVDKRKDTATDVGQSGYQPHFMKAVRTKGQCYWTCGFHFPGCYRERCFGDSAQPPYVPVVQESHGIVFIRAASVGQICPSGCHSSYSIPPSLELCFGLVTVFSTAFILRRLRIGPSSVPTGPKISRLERAQKMPECPQRRRLPGAAVEKDVELFLCSEMALEAFLKCPRAVRMTR